AANDVRSSGRAVEGPEKFPERIRAENVILEARIIDDSEAALCRRSHFAVVVARFFGKRPGLPALHPCRQNRDGINATELHRRVATNGLKACATEDLASAGDMLHACEAIIIGDTVFRKRGAHQT